MNTDNLNKWLNLLSNVAVLAGIVFLVVELQQNNLYARAQTRSEISRISVENSRMFQDPKHLEIRTKILNGEELTRADEVWLGQAYRSELKSWENIYYQYRIGLFDQPELEAYQVTWSNRFNNSVCERPRGIIFLRVYENLRLQLEPNFRRELDSLRDKATCNL